VAGALAERREAELPLREREPRVRPVPGRGRRPSHSRARLQTRLAQRLIIFGVCVAFLAAGRVALTFAVVQKNLQTNAVVHQQTALSNDNARLAERVAQFGSTTRVHQLAVNRYGLVPATDVRYLSVHGGSATSGRGQ
jgi:hypothetical protein